MKTRSISRNKIAMMAIIAVIIFAVASCGNNQDGAEKLKDLREQKTALEQQIAELEKQLAAEGRDPNQGRKIPAVTAQTMSPKKFEHFIEVRGSVESDNNIFVPAQRPGIVTRVLVSPGDRVKKGQLMAELDNESISQTIREIKNGLGLATTLYERQKNLWDQKIGTEVQYLQAKTSKEDLEIKLKNAQSELDKTRIYAPISGMVDVVTLKEGEAASPNAGAIRVSNLSKQKVVAKISESYLTDIRVGDSVKVTFPVNDLQLKTKVSAVSQVIDPDNRTIDLEVLLPDDNRINPNMLAVLTLTDYTNPSAMLLPINAVQQAENRNYVFVARKNNDAWVAELRDVKLGRYSENEVEITEGIIPGEVVITFGFNNISVGDPVKVDFDNR
ncbi:MAG: efflux RND transporter periplasmic adaptor subunit [Clostridia bacterium]|nr:efflux RND transporter periplasmic adaptor subunit [Clostridia bacterium]